MFYLAAAGAGLSAVSNILQSKEQGNLAIQQSKASLARLGKLQDQLNLQSAQDARNTSASLFNIQVQGNAEASQVKLQSAANDTIGASVQDALSTINVITDRQAANAKAQYSAAEEERYRQITGEAEATGAEIKATLNAATGAERGAVLGSALNGASALLGLIGEGEGKGAADAALKGESYLGNITTKLSSFYSQYLK